MISCICQNISFLLATESQNPYIKHFCFILASDLTLESGLMDRGQVHIFYFRSKIMENGKTITTGDLTLSNSRFFAPLSGCHGRLSTSQSVPCILLCHTNSSSLAASNHSHLFLLSSFLAAPYSTSFI